MVFGELLAGYLSWLSIPLLGLGLCVGMIRGWSWGDDVWSVINVDVSASPSSSASSPASVMTPGDGGAGLPAAQAPSAAHDSSP